MVTGGNLLQAHMWRGLLETSGIEVKLLGEALLGGMTCVGNVALRVVRYISH